MLTTAAKQEVFQSFPHIKPSFGFKLFGILCINCMRLDGPSSSSTVVWKRAAFLETSPSVLHGRKPNGFVHFSFPASRPNKPQNFCFLFIKETSTGCVPCAGIPEEHSCLCLNDLKCLWPLAVGAWDGPKKRARRGLWSRTREACCSLSFYHILMSLAGGCALVILPLDRVLTIRLWRSGPRSLDQNSGMILKLHY